MSDTYVGMDVDLDTPVAVFPAGTQLGFDEDVREGNLGLVIGDARCVVAFCLEGTPSHLADLAQRIHEAVADLAEHALVVSNSNRADDHGKP